MQATQLGVKTMEMGRAALPAAAPLPVSSPTAARVVSFSVTWQHKMNELSQTGLSQTGLSQVGLSQAGLSEQGLSQARVGEKSLKQTGTGFSDTAQQVEGKAGREVICTKGKAALQSDAPVHEVGKTSSAKTVPAGRGRQSSLPAVGDDVTSGLARPTAPDPAGPVAIAQGANAVVASQPTSRGETDINACAVEINPASPAPKFAAVASGGMGKDLVVPRVRTESRDGVVGKDSEPAATATPLDSARAPKIQVAGAVAMAVGTHTNGIGSAIDMDSLHGGGGGRMGGAIAPGGGASGTRGELETTVAPRSTGVGIQVLAAGPAKLDVGVFDGTHGWLRIGAELGPGGAVNASLTASGAAHASMRAALPEMARYLDAEAVNVSSIAVHRAARSDAMAGAGGQHSSEAQGQRQPQGNNQGSMAKGGTGSVKGDPSLEWSPVAAWRGDTEDASGNAGSLTYETAGHGSGYGPGLRWAGGSSGGWLNVSA